MKCKAWFAAGLVLFTGFYAFCRADELNHTLFGDGSMAIGQIYHGQGDQGGKCDHRWLEGAGMVFGDSVTSDGRATMIVEGVSRLQYSYWVNPNSGDKPGWITRNPIWDFRINRAEGSYTFLDPEKNPLVLTLGFFKYKYNPDVKNLGEYLFRSFAYPNYVETVFDEPFSRLLGLKLSNTLFGGRFKHDFIVSSEWERFPFWDVSLAYLAEVNLFNNSINIGAGGQLFHWLSVNESYTSPEHTDREGTYYYKTQADSASNTKTGYSFKGEKVMLRFSIKPLAMVPEIKAPVVGTLFDQEDLKLYAEADVLGLKNYPIYGPKPPNALINSEYYNILSERIPVTLGINLPRNPLFSYGIFPSGVALFAQENDVLPDMGHRLPWIIGSAATTAATLILQNVCNLNTRPDALGLELEYQSNRYANSWGYVYNYFAPIPDWQYKSESTLLHSRWRWSVYTMKRMDHFFVKLQVARDHMRAFLPQLDFQETSDVVPRAEHWWWALKTGYSF